MGKHVVGKIWFEDNSLSHIWVRGIFDYNISKFHFIVSTSTNELYWIVLFCASCILDLVPFTFFYLCITFYLLCRMHLVPCLMHLFLCVLSYSIHLVLILLLIYISMYIIIYIPIICIYNSFYLHMHPIFRIYPVLGILTVVDQKTDWQTNTPKY
jgi:hypothetical protein